MTTHRQPFPLLVCTAAASSIRLCPVKKGTPCTYTALNIAALKSFIEHHAELLQFAKLLLRKLWCNIFQVSQINLYYVQLFCFVCILTVAEVTI